MLTPEQLSEIEERTNAATEGPWIAEYSSEQGDCVIPHDAHSTREAVAVCRLYLRAFDAEFIAHARTDVPKLVAEVKRLQAAASVVESVRATWPGLGTLWDVDTDLVRQGWPLPTCYREHEVIHILAGVIDYQRGILEKANN